MAVLRLSSYELIIAFLLLLINYHVKIVCSRGIVEVSNKQLQDSALLEGCSGNICLINNDCCHNHKCFDGFCSKSEAKRDEPMLEGCSGNPCLSSSHCCKNHKCLDGFCAKQGRRRAEDLSFAMEDEKKIVETITKRDEPVLE
eukprot:Awhi_evm1s10705